MKRKTQSTPDRSIARARWAASIAGVALVAASQFADAQITQPTGPAQPDSRAAAMGTRPDEATSAVHESNDKPQSKDAGTKHTRGKTIGKTAEGAGGFENGLYGTGAGNNK